MASADTSIFTLVIGDHPPETFRVLEFSGQEALSESYVFRIKAVAFDVMLKYEDTIGSVAVLVVKGKGYAINHFGMITHFNQVPEIDGEGQASYYYEFTLEPVLKHMAYRLRSRIWQNKNVKEIVEELLKEYDSQGTHTKFEAKFETQGKDYPKREFTVQYNETDWDFLKRMLEDEGIYWYWTHEGDNEVLVMASGSHSVKPLVEWPELPFMPEGGLSPVDGREYVDTLERSVRFVTGRASIKDYNYRTPDVNVIGQHEMEGPGAYDHYGDHVKTTDEANRKALIRAEMFACQREIYKGTGIFRSARPGYRFKLVEAKAEGFDGEYLITRVTHIGGFASMDDGTVDGPQPHYRCAFEAIPAKTVFRPPLLTPKPRVNGILTALTDGQEDKYAYIDDEGRYKVKLFFDPSDEGEGKASKAIRLAQPYAGPEYGMHFPLHTGTEIAIGFVDGDLDRPIGLGAVPNPVQGSPVKAGNKHQNMMKSHAGNSLILEDKEGSTGIHLATSGGHTMGFDDAAGSKGLSAKTSGGHSMALDDKGQGISFHTTGGIDLKLDDKGTKVLIDTHGNSLEMADSGNVITLKTAAGDSCLTLKGDGNVELKTSKEIKLVVGGSSITMNTNGTIDIAGKTINIKASDAVLVEGTNTATVKGKALALNGDNSANLGAPTVDVKAGQSLGLSGGIVSSEATGANIVKGASVMLNP